MLIYSVTWVYKDVPDRTRTVVGTFQDVDEIYRTLLEQNRVAHGGGRTGRLSGKCLLGARVDAVGSHGGPVLSWGSDLNTRKEVEELLESI